MIKIINKRLIKLSQRNNSYKMNIFHKLIEKEKRVNHHYFKSNNQNSNLLNCRKKNCFLIKLSKNKSKITKGYSNNQMIKEI